MPAVSLTIGENFVITGVLVGKLELAIDRLGGGENFRRVRRHQTQLELGDLGNQSALTRGIDVVTLKAGDLNLETIATLGLDDDFFSTEDIETLADDACGLVEGLGSWVTLHFDEEFGATLKIETECDGHFAMDGPQREAAGEQAGNNGAQAGGATGGGAIRGQIPDEEDDESEAGEENGEIHGGNLV